MMSTIFSIVGTLLIIHSAYSYRHYIKLVDSIEVSYSIKIPPIDVIIEIFFGALLILSGLLLSLKLKPIRVSNDIKAKSYQEVIGGTDYMVFNHRGKVLADRKKQ